MRFVKVLAIAVVVLVVLAGGIGLLLPRAVHVERSVHIDAHPSTVFAVVDGYRQFDLWSPWADLDPKMKVTTDGALYGVGAHYAWAGNKAVGSGTQEISASKPYSEVDVKLSFGGFDQPNTAKFLVAPDGDGSRITWSFDTMFGANPYTRLFVPMMKKSIGADYERGLGRLKTFVESLPKADFSNLKADLVQGTPSPYLYVSGTTTTDEADIGKALGTAYGTIGAYMKTARLTEAAPPIFIARRRDEAKKVYEYDAGIPVAATVQSVPDGSAVKLGKTSAGLLLRVEYKGPYSGFEQVYAAINAYKLAYGLQDNGDSWEQYVSDPGNTAPADLITIINVPVK